MLVDIKKLRERLAHYQAIVDKEVEGEQEAYNAAIAAACKAEYTYTAERDRLALQAATNVTGPYNIGTKMVEWSCRPYYRSSRATPTGRVGIVEVWTKDSRQSERLIVYRLPSVGSKVVRILKKDGSPGVGFVNFRSLQTPPSGWYPEGVNPNLREVNPIGNG